MRITAKVKPHAAKDPAAVVRDALKQAHAAAGARSHVEEVFPGLKSGRRAGMVTVTLPDELREEESEAVLKALRDHDDIEYAEPAAPRSAK